MLQKIFQWGFFAILLSTNLYANNERKQSKMWITMGADVITALTPEMTSGVKVYYQNTDAAVLEVTNETVLTHLEEMIHQKFNRCGGYKVHTNLTEALAALENPKINNAPLIADNNFKIDQNDTVTKLIALVDEMNIRETIIGLSSFKNRFYKSKTGEESQAHLFNLWSKIAAGRSDVSIEYFTHRNFPQKSIILTIKGTTRPNDVIVIGGHADSISGYFDRMNSRAPGSDDNASGIATITEVLRILMESDYRPQRTVQFMAYAAEEVGLLGSDEIAKNYRSRSINVLSVLQLDMTGFKNGQWDLSLMSDYTSSSLSKVLASLIDIYLPSIPWGYSKCGYACSDHASWHQQSYSAAIPFETSMDDMNKKIHTPNDTLENLGNSAIHSVPFSQLSLAYVIEMAK